MVGALLTAEGYEVTEAESGADALAKTKEGEPDIALLDLMMPGALDGMATLAKLREAAPDLPVIMMSGRAGLADAVSATKLGAFNFLEKPLTPGAFLGGHLVSGHVDGVGEVTGVRRGQDGGAWMSIRAPRELLRYLVEKGSVCVDGVSLTVAALDGESFAVALIPHTLDVTTLGETEVGDPVNLEIDVIAKYVEALMDGGGA